MRCVGCYEISLALTNFTAVPIVLLGGPTPELKCHNQGNGLTGVEVGFRSEEMKVFVGYSVAASPLRF